MTDHPRFDVVYTQHGPRLDFHFCREWDESGGCYGTNPNHGMSFDEAKEEVAKWHEATAAAWRRKTLDEWQQLDEEF